MSAENNDGKVWFDDEPSEEPISQQPAKNTGCNPDGASPMPQIFSVQTKFAAKHGEALQNRKQEEKPE